MTTLRDAIIDKLDGWGKVGEVGEYADALADAILTLLPQHYDEVKQIINANCTCGYGGQHEEANPNCEMNR